MIKDYKNYQFLSVKTKNESTSGYNSHLKNYSVIFALPSIFSTWIEILSCSV